MIFHNTALFVLQQQEFLFISSRCQMLCFARLLFPCHERRDITSSKRRSCGDIRTMPHLVDSCLKTVRTLNSMRLALRRTQCLSKDNYFFAQKMLCMYVYNRSVHYVA